MATEKILGLWMQPSGVEIMEIEYDHDAHAYDIAYDGRYVVTIYADSPEQGEAMRASLDAGEDVRDWEGGNGHSVGELIAKRTGAGLRETLRRIEDAGTCYNAKLDNGADGTLWADEVYDIYYEYETDDDLHSVDYMTDEDLKDVIIGGL